MLGLLGVAAVARLSPGGCRGWSAPGVAGVRLISGCVAWVAVARSRGCAGVRRGAFASGSGGVGEFWANYDLEGRGWSLGFRGVLAGTVSARSLNMCMCIYVYIYTFIRAI